MLVFSHDHTQNLNISTSPPLLIHSQLPLIMPLPKSKNAATNGKQKTPAPNGAAASSPAGEKVDTSVVVLLPGGKPDKQAHEKDQDRIKAEIDALQLSMVSLSRVTFFLTRQ